MFIANDWHTALLPVYLKAYYRDNGFMTYARSVLVIHNIAHQVRLFFVTITICVHTTWILLVAVIRKYCYYQYLL